jgi:hypothetical protein
VLRVVRSLVNRVAEAVDGDAKAAHLAAREEAYAARKALAEEKAAAALHAADAAEAAVAGAIAAVLTAFSPEEAAAAGELLAEAQTVADKAAADTCEEFLEAPPVESDEEQEDEQGRDEQEGQGTDWRRHAHHGGLGGVGGMGVAEGDQGDQGVTVRRQSPRRSTVERPLLEQVGPDPIPNVPPRPATPERPSTPAVRCPKLQLFSPVRCRSGADPYPFAGTAGGISIYSYSLRRIALLGWTPLRLPMVTNYVFSIKGIRIVAGRDMEAGHPWRSHSCRRRPSSSAGVARPPVLPMPNSPDGLRPVRGAVRCADTRNCAAGSPAGGRRGTPQRLPQLSSPGQDRALPRPTRVSRGAAPRRPVDRVEEEWDRQWAILQMSLRAQKAPPPPPRGSAAEDAATRRLRQESAACPGPPRSFTRP